MDLNYLFHRQQVESSLAKSAESRSARAVHQELALEYERQINRLTAGDGLFQHADTAPDRVSAE